MAATTLAQIAKETDAGGGVHGYTIKKSATQAGQRVPGSDALRCCAYRRLRWTAGEDGGLHRSVPGPVCVLSHPDPALTLSLLLAAGR